MTPKMIGVGIIGANAGRGWAHDAHIPALRALPGYRIAALSTTRSETAAAAAAHHGVALGFDSAQTLAAHPDVDLVAVTVKVPHHAELVAAALQARKEVHCEWPLARDLTEARRMTEDAKIAGVRATVGLQARAAPVVRHVRRLVADGYVGKVLSTTLTGSVRPWGDGLNAFGVYLIDARNGATILTIPFGHSVDALCWCLGEFQELSAVMANQRPEVTRLDTGETLVKTAEDQVSVTGVLASGAVAAIHYRGRPGPGPGLRWEISGSEGDLVVTGASGHMQMVDLTLMGARGDEDLRMITPPPACVAAPDAPSGVAFNVAQAYALRLDPAAGDVVPDFADGVLRHRMIEAIRRAAATGQRQSYLD